MSVYKGAETDADTPRASGLTAFPNRKTPRTDDETGRSSAGLFQNISFWGRERKPVFYTFICVSSKRRLINFTKKERED